MRRQPRQCSPPTFHVSCQQSITPRERHRNTAYSSSGAMPLAAPTKFLGIMSHSHYRYFMHNMPFLIILHTILDAAASATFYNVLTNMMPKRSRAHIYYFKGRVLLSIKLAFISHATTHGTYFSSVSPRTFFHLIVFFTHDFFYLITM